MRRGARGGARGTGGRGGRGDVRARLGEAVASIAGSPRQGGGGAGRSWHKVQLTNGSKYPGKDLLRVLCAASETPIQPICYVKMVNGA